MADVSRRNNFDAIRLFAAILVIYGHSYPLTGAISPQIAGTTVQVLGVKIFFAISGFLISLSWIKDPNLFRYLQRRSLRIFPALILVVLVSACILGPVVTTLSIGDYFSGDAFRRYFLNIPLYINYSLPGVFADNHYPHTANGSLWSLPAEFAMYLLIPAVLLVAVNFRLVSLMAALIFAVASVYALYISPQQPVVIYATNLWSWLEVAPYFMAGSLLAVLSDRHKPNLQIGLAAFLCLLVIRVPSALQAFFLIFTLTYLCIAFALTIPSVFERAGRFGDLSYGIYLYAFPVQQTLSHYFGKMNPWVNFILAVPIVMVCAFISWHGVEKRALRLKPGSRRPAISRRELVVNETTSALS